MRPITRLAFPKMSFSSVYEDARPKWQHEPYAINVRTINVIDILRFESRAAAEAMQTQLTKQGYRLA